jgi:membrane protease YdiL (CAAX protease family)
LATPPILLVSTYVAFRWGSESLGAVPGYLAGFVFYWLVWCAGLPLLVLGGDALALFRPAARPFGHPRWIGLLAVGAPLVLGFGYAFPRAVTTASPAIVALSLLLAIVNAPLEELLWRGAYLRVFPSSAPLGWLYPSLGFAVWHFAPQSVFANSVPGGAVSLVLVAGVFGLGWAYVARSTGSLLAVALAHALFDFSGLGGRVYLG